MCSLRGLCFIFPDFPAVTVCNLNVFRKEVVEAQPIMSQVTRLLFPVPGEETSTNQMAAIDPSVMEQLENIDVNEAITENKQPVS